MAHERLLVGIFFVHVSSLISGEPATDRFIASECFGSVLSLSCKKGHRIKIIDDFFGLSSYRPGADTCHYVPGDCTITNSRYSSVIHRYCEGLETCTRFQVDRRNCGANLTNYEQVEYQCVSDDDVINICSRVSLKSTEGYISTPNFPNEYTPNSHCRCTLRTERADVFVRLSFTQFIIKYDNPCKDWVEVLLDGDVRRLCGAYRSTLASDVIEIVFHSDSSQGHQGFWLYFRAHPQTGNNVYIECGPEKYLIPTKATTTTVTRTTTTITTVASTTTTATLASITAIRRSSQKYWTSVRGSDLINKKKVSLPENELIKQNRNEVYLVEDDVETRSLLAWPDGSTDRPDNKYKTGLNELQQIRRHNSRLTGIIIISICVGGIVLLVVILTVLLCVNKRKRSRPSTMTPKADKIKDRLNSLSFYDSIPLYDSIGRNGGVPRAPPIGGDVKLNTKSLECGHYVSGSKRIRSDGPYWTTIHGDPDSDHDSAIYAELDRQSRDGLQDLGSPKSLDAGDTSASFSVSLDTTSDICRDDISTHV